MNSDQSVAPNRHAKRAAGFMKPAYSPNDVARMVSGQAAAQTDAMGRLLASAIGMVLHRLGESHITIGPDDINALSKTHRVEIVPESADRTFTYRLVRIAQDDQETVDMLRSGEPNLPTLTILLWIGKAPVVREILLSAAGPSSSPREHRVARVIRQIETQFAGVQPHEGPGAESQTHAAKRNLENAPQWRAEADWDLIITRLEAARR